MPRGSAAGATGEDHIPFFVLPPKGEAKAPVAFLAASATYLAYANSHDAYEDPTAERAHGALLTLSPTDLFLMARRDLGLSTYDVHRDGSGCFYSSRLRPDPQYAAEAGALELQCRSPCHGLAGGAGRAL